MEIGFIGLGAMGLPMAKNVLQAGHKIYTSFHSNSKPAEELASMGASILNTPAEVAKKAEVVITVLPADKELEEVVLGNKGLINGFSEGNVLIDMTTATGITLENIEKQLLEKHVSVIDAPVSGGTAGAEAGTLTIITGCTESLFEEYKPLLETMGNNIFHVGDVGQGKVVKMINQLLAATHLMALGEAFTLGIKSGADPEVLYDVIKKSSGHSKMMDMKLTNYLFKGNFTPGFKVDLMKKDVNLAIDSAKQLGVPLFYGGVTSQIFAAASSAGYGDLDHSRAAQFIAELANATFER